MARVPYLDAHTAPPEVSEVFRKIEARGARVINLYRAMAHSKAALLPFLKLGNSLLTSAKLDGRLRELAILRVAILLGSRYEWQQHEPLAREMGVTEAQLAELPDWEKGHSFDEREKAVLAYVDEVTRNVAVSDTTHERVSRFLDHAEMVELAMSIGFWGMVGRFLVALDVDLEEDVGTTGGSLLGKSQRK